MPRFGAEKRQTKTQRGELTFGGTFTLGYYDCPWMVKRLRIQVENNKEVEK